MRIPTALKGAAITATFIGGVAAGPMLAAAPASAATAPAAAVVSAAPGYFYHATGNGPADAPAADPGYFYHA